jgi:hypothetical protein
MSVTPFFLMQRWLAKRSYFAMGKILNIFRIPQIKVFTEELSELLDVWKSIQIS